MRLNVEQAGAQHAGTPIVFVHGMGGSTATWRAVMDLLARRHHVLAVDLPGHGASPVPDDPAEYSRDGALADLEELLATLPPAVLVGHSLGGYLSLAYAATRPGGVCGIVVENTGPGFRDPDKREAWNERSRRNAHRFGVPEHVAGLNLQHDSVVMDRAADIQTPTLVLAGGDDRPEYTASGEYLQRKMPHARLVVLPGGGHSMHEDTHAAEVAQLIEDFVAAL
jgi:pimeloyl-ACP methyl ester carboxylesterase